MQTREEDGVPLSFLRPSLGRGNVNVMAVNAGGENGSPAELAERVNTAPRVSQHGSALLSDAW